MNHVMSMGHGYRRMKMEMEIGGIDTGLGMDKDIDMAYSHRHGGQACQPVNHGTTLCNLHSGWVRIMYDV